ncbi:hypothetical protein GIX45_01190 [Erwinia sp. CPCC 100877]|nr:hypothetical protein [Erwinia sp. CPCC 100877]
MGTSPVAVAPGGLTTDNTPTVTGKSDPNAKITVYDNGSKIGEVVADGNGDWVFTPGSPLADGEHSFTSVATDAKGNTGEPSASYDVEIDATAPDAPVISSITDDVGSAVGSIGSGGATDDNMPTLSGKGTPGDTITITDGGSPIGSVVVDDNGEWTFTPDAPLADGEHNLAVTETDPAGNTSAPSDSFPIVIDTTPQIEGDTSLLDDTGKVTGVIASGGITDDNQPDYSGKTEPGAEVIIRDNGIEIGRVTADDNGDWVFTPDTPLADGEHSFTAQPSDSSGNVGDESAATDFVVDTTPMTVAIENVMDDTGAVTGALTAGQATDDVTPTINGSATPGALVSIYDDGVLIGTVTATTEGTWSFTPSTELAEGEHNFTATVTSEAQGESDPTTVFPITIDTTPPEAPAIGSIADDIGTITGPIAAGGITDDNQPTLSGSGVPGDTITITDGGQPIGTAIVGDDGNWTFTPDTPLVDGEHDLSVIATDPAGNVSAPSVDYPITVDTKMPEAPVITGVVDDVSPVEGNIAEGGLTNDAQPLISGTAEANSIVTVFIDGTSAGTIAADADGNWSFTPSANISDGTHQITASAADAAGNRSDLSNIWSVVVDTVSETPVITSVMDDVEGLTGNVASGGLTNDALPSISGTAEPNSTVTLYLDDTAIGSVKADDSGTWSYALVSPLTDGEHQFSAMAVDSAGNTSSQSSVWSVTVDTQAPTSSMDYLFDDAGDVSGNIPGGGSLDDTRPTLGGSAEAGSVVTVFIDGTEVGSTNANSSGSWSYTPATDLEAGQHSFQVIATDAAGNSSEKTPAYTVTIEAAAAELTDRGDTSSTPVESLSLQFSPAGLEATNHTDGTLSVNPDVRSFISGDSQESPYVSLAKADVLTPEHDDWLMKDETEAGKEGSDSALVDHSSSIGKAGEYYNASYHAETELVLLVQQGGGVVH